MSLQEKLQIILITYNRAKYAKRTLERFLAADSPVRDCDFLILDNNSTDDTAQVAREFQQKYAHVSYQKNRYNLGISGNIARAMELATQEYVWILGDDDVYDFTHWNEAEQAMARGEKMICLANYAIPPGHENDIAYQLFQLTFITGGIYHTSLFNDTTMRNAYDNLFTLFPHMLPIFALVNKGTPICVLPHAIADNGLRNEPKDSSFTRGATELSALSSRTRNMIWILGYATVLPLLKDKNLQTDCMKVALSHTDIMPSDKSLYKYLRDLRKHNRNFFYDLYPVLPKEKKRGFWLFMLKRKLHIH